MAMKLDISTLLCNLIAAGLSQADIRKMYLKDPRWNEIKEVLYNSKANVFSYLDIKLTDKVAEIGALSNDFGSTADALERKYQGLKVDRIAAIIADKADENVPQYDWLIVTAAECLFKPNGDESAWKWLKRANRYLATNGRMILLVDNPHSIWNINQASEIKRLDDNQDCYGLRRAKRVIRKAGLQVAHLAYVAPSYKDAWNIYTDAGLPSTEEWSNLEVLRNVEADNFGDNRFETKYEHLLMPLRAEKKALITDVMRNGEFGLLAPSHMLILTAGVHEKPRRMMGALRQSTDADYSYATSMQVGKPSFKYRVFNEYEDASTIEDVKQVQLNLLKKYKSICEKYNLKYYLIYGTLLGAVRTGEMIAADDDIDVAMMREDYDKFVEIASEELGNDYFLQTPSNDNAFYGGYLKLQKNDTTELVLQNWWVDCHEGISIDIFPIDKMLADEAVEESRQNSIATYQRMLFAQAYGYFREFRDIPFLTWKICKYAGKAIGKMKLISGLTSAMRAGEKGESDGYGIYAHYTEGKPVTKLERKWFTETVYLPFEGELYPVPSGFSELLKARYGENYILPYAFNPELARHGFYDAHKPYYYHKDKLLKRRDQLPMDKSIVLISDGLSVKDFAKKYTDVKVDRVINVDMQQEIELDLSTEYPVLALADIRCGQRLMESISVEDYKIFVDDRELLRKANFSFWKLGKWYKENPED